MQEIPKEAGKRGILKQESGIDQKDTVKIKDADQFPLSYRISYNSR